MPSGTTLVDAGAVDVGLTTAAWLPRPVRVPLICTTSPGVIEGAEHDVVLHPDGSLETPHDLEAERIGVALGGYLSCLEVVDRVLPAVRQWLAWQRREQTPSLRRDKQGLWLLRDRQSCCGTGRLRAADAAEHGRSVRHLAEIHRTSPTLLRCFTSALCVEFGWPEWGAPLDPQRGAAAQRCVSGLGGAAQLWAAGIRPEVIVRIHAALAGCRSRLPVEFYLGVTTRRPDLAWVLSSAVPAEPGEPDPETLTWLAWTETAHDRQHPAERGEWLRLGVPRSLLLDISASRYSCQDVRDLGAAVGRTPAHAATLLLSWVHAGLHVEVGRLITLHHAGVPDLRLNSSALRRLVADLGSAGIDLTESVAAELLLVWGNVPEAAACARAGRVDPLAIARALYPNGPLSWTPSNA